MKRYLLALLMVLALVGSPHQIAAEEGKVPSESDVYKTIVSYIETVTEASGKLNLYDPVDQKPLHLIFVKAHEKVTKTGNNYYGCADFTDAKSEQKYDLDFDVAYVDGDLKVVELRIHKIGKKARYNYDENNARVAIDGKDSYLGGLGMPRIRSKK